MEHSNLKSISTLLRRWPLIAGIIFVSMAAYASVNFDYVRATKIDAGNIRTTADTVSTIDTNGDLTITPNGSGKVIYTPGTASTVPYLDSSKKITSSAVTPTELGYLSGVTSAIQTQLGLKAPLANPTFTGTVTGTFTGNLTGNASTATTAGTVTTNANLTGPITSVGNATSVAAQTGTGSTFVMQASPTLTTPNLGTPSTLVGTNITGTAASLTAGTVTTNANLTGDVTSAGNATTIGAGKVTNSMLAGSIAASKFVGSDIATVGTITTGTWTGTTIAIANGGTGQTSAAAALLALVPSQGIGNLGQPLVSSGNSGISPTWGVLNSAGGGTGLTSPTANAVLLTNGSSAMNTVAPSTSGNVLTSNGTTWTSATPASAPAGIQPYNFLVNGGFDFWQAGTSVVITATGGATPTATYGYQADQWYVNNILGGGTVEGQITYSQISLLGSGVATKYGATIQITRAPTGTGIQNGTELWQTLSNRATIPLIGQTASFSLPVLALNNVNQVGLQFFYSTSEIKAGTSIGAETTCAVNNSTYTTCSISGQALGTSMTYSGTVGVRVRTTAVSSGNTYDLNNGFQVATAMWNIGSTAATFARQSNNPASELIACQYFYEKSYAITTAPGTNVGVAADGGWVFRHIYTATGTGATRMSIKYLVPKRTAAAVTTWSTDGTLGKIRDATNSTNITPSVITSGTMGWTIEVAPSATTIDHNLEGHWQADARL